MSLFGKKDKSSGYFFDQEGDLDPWSLPSVSFFKDKKRRISSKTHPADKDVFRELSFDRLDDSYSKISEQRLSRTRTIQPQYVEEPNIEINPNQRLFDVYPSEKFRTHVIRNTTPEDDNANVANMNPIKSPRLPPAQKLPRPTLKPERSVEKAYPPNRVLREPQEYAETLWQSEQIAEQRYADQTAPEGITAKDHSIPHEYDEARSRAQDYRFLAKVSLTGGVFICCGLVLWWISQQGTYQTGDPDNIATIPSPKNFKIQNDDTSRLVPLQDALIYGVLTPNNEEGERLLHNATKDDVDFEPKVDNDDDYLDTAEHVQTKALSVQPDVYPDTAGLNISGLNNHSRLPRVTPQAQQNAQKSNNDAKNNASQNRTISSGKPDVKGVALKPLANASKPAFLQIATLSSVDKANQEVMRLVRKHRILSKYPISIHPYTTEKGTVIYRLLVGPIDAEADVQSVAKTLGLKGVSQIHSP
ncbi:MAG: SPOR domain-containing protein [Holosporales bacterium]|jgi:hypothetical protein|nr:SPOR domain-containing protein [Holosporales bacterium]